jgi:hypothetical protein
MFVLEVLNKNLEHNSKPTLNSLFRMALITGSGRGIGKKQLFYCPRRVSISLYVQEIGMR